MGVMEELSACVPASREEEIPWKRIDPLLADSGFTDMEDDTVDVVYFSPAA